MTLLHKEEDLSQRMPSQVKIAVEPTNWGQLVQLDSDQTCPFSILTNWFGQGLTVFN